MYKDTNILQFEKIPLFTGRVADDSSDPPNTSISPARYLFSFHPELQSWGWITPPD